MSELTKNELGRLLCTVGFLLAMHLAPPEDGDKAFMAQCAADIQKTINRLRLTESDGA